MTKDLSEGADNLLDWMYLCATGGCKIEVAANLRDEVVLKYRANPSDSMDRDAVWWGKDFDEVWEMMGKYPDGMLES